MSGCGFDNYGMLGVSPCLEEEDKNGKRSESLLSLPPLLTCSAFTILLLYYRSV